MEVRADVGDGDCEDDGGDVVAAHDEATVLTQKGEATFDGRRDDVDEPVHDHALSAQAGIIKTAQQQRLGISTTLQIILCWGETFPVVSVKIITCI